MIGCSFVHNADQTRKETIVVIAGVRLALGAGNKHRDFFVPYGRKILQLTETAAENSVHVEVSSLPNVDAEIENRTGNQTICVCPSRKQASRDRLYACANLLFPASSALALFVPPGETAPFDTRVFASPRDRGKEENDLFGLRERRVWVGACQGACEGGVRAASLCGGVRNALVLAEGAKGERGGVHFGVTRKEGALVVWFADEQKQKREEEKVAVGVLSVQMASINVGVFDEDALLLFAGLSQLLLTCKRERSSRGKFEEISAAVSFWKIRVEAENKIVVNGRVRARACIQTQG